MTDAYILEAVRSPIGKRNGSLSEMRPDDLAGDVLKGLVQRAQVDPGEVEDVIMGCVTQVEEQGYNIGRMAALVAGFPSVCPVQASTECARLASSLRTSLLRLWAREPKTW